MSKELLPIPEVPFFENDKHVDPQGVETWSARDICQRFGYDNWDAFEKVIRMAQAKSNLKDIDPRTQFRESIRLVNARGEHSPVKDYELTRYACYLIAQHADPKNPRIAEAQIYFSLHTYRQEKLGGLNEDQQRLVLRGEISVDVTKLSRTAKRSGLNVRHFGSFHDEGYLGLYRMKHRALKSHRGITSESVLDQIGPTELVINILRITKTQEALHNALDRGYVPGDVRTQEAHNIVSSRVRKAMVDIGGIVPEELPVYDHTKEARKRHFQKINR